MPITALLLLPACMDGHILSDRNKEFAVGKRLWPSEMRRVQFCATETDDKVSVLMGTRSIESALGNLCSISRTTDEPFRVASDCLLCAIGPMGTIVGWQVVGVPKVLLPAAAQIIDHHAQDIVKYFKSHGYNPEESLRKIQQGTWEPDEVLTLMSTLDKAQQIMYNLPALSTAVYCLMGCISANRGIFSVFANIEYTRRNTTGGSEQRNMLNQLAEKATTLVKDNAQILLTRLSPNKRVEIVTAL